METATVAPVHCDTCGSECVPSGCTTGYGIDRSGRKHCFKCCAERERAEMIRSGKGCLYLTTTNGSNVGSLTDWPGGLRFICTVARGRHNIARTRYDVRFTGPDGKAWYGTQYGDNTQICRVRRAK